MSRVDWLVLKRMSSRIAGAVLVFYGLIVLVEALDTWRFNYVRDTFGLLWAIVMLMAAGARWTIKTLPVTVLLGGIIGLIDLKARHELTVIKASGLSFWRIVRAPALGVLVAALGVSMVVETQSTRILRELAPTPPGEASLLQPPGEIWIEERAIDDSARDYIIAAENMSFGGSRLQNLTVFIADNPTMRIEAEEAELRDGEWFMPSAVLRRLDQPPRRVSDYLLPTSSTPAAIELQLTSVQDVTFFELARLLRNGIADETIAAAVLTRFLKLLSMPLVLVGSLLIAFAFTAGYRRSDKYGPSILYGVVLGFVVFVVTEMSERAGSGGVLHPVLAALGPAFVAIVIGVTVLLYKEDGRA
ncbi:LPS export ABC transporter permease LptG [Devosia pacifica]|uniref:LPS export ABC transporter permease LptG n=1 Tax=Devosia pacifica TaxID=1335967 RepID=A0A918VW66_9HYPH|nr:LptF/LptG family permease [Devosia pacifica]GHA35353.1 LPS export ABC transporter permease LptG [Devosia pacifica]